MIIATLLARNEEEIIEECILHHLNNGVDKIIATDNNSTDSTREILSKYAIELIDEPLHNHNQGIWVTRMARLAFKYKPDWIVNIDADEFWYGLSNLYRYDDSVAAVYLPHIYEHIPCKNFGKFNRYKNPFYIKVKSFGRFAHRSTENVTITQGNHQYGNIKGKVVHLSNDIISMHHYPFRNYDFYEKKIIQGGQAYEKYPGPKGDAFHWRRCYQLYKQGKLRSEFERFFMSPEKHQMICDGNGGIAYSLL